MKRAVWTILICAAVLLIAALATGYWARVPDSGTLRVGFLYSEDESTPYTANFVQAQRLLEETYGNRVEVHFCSNVLSRDAERPLRDLVRAGCRIIFINNVPIHKQISKHNN